MRRSVIVAAAPIKTLGRLLPVGAREGRSGWTRLLNVRLAVIGATVGLCAVVVALSTAQAAYACTNIPGNNWGVAEWFNTANDQGGGRVNTTVSATGISGAPSGHHINQTIWVGTNGATSLQYWIELKRPGFRRGSFIWQPGFGCCRS